jgi:hypothetical protein
MLEKLVIKVLVTIPYSNLRDISKLLLTTIRTKNEISHRGKATKQLLAHLKTKVKQKQ